MKTSKQVKAEQVESLNARLKESMQQVLMPPPDLSLSEWSENYLYLSPEASSLSGRFRFDRAPYQRECFDALSDPHTRKVVIMAASQTLKTQSVLAYIGYIIHLDPAPILCVQPSNDQAKTFSKDRIDTMIRDVPEIRARVASKRERDGGNTTMHKTFAGGALTIATANSPSALAARPIRYLFFDEVDRYEVTKEGSAVKIAEKRTTTYWNSKQVLVSSPADEEVSIIAREYELSDKRIYLVPCHDCGAEQELTWDNVKWIQGEPHTAQYECAHCSTMWDDIQRNTNVAYGRWEKTNPKSNIAGFHISALYSSFVTLGDLAVEWYNAKDEPEELKVFVNTRLAQTWKTDATTVNNINWMTRLEEYTPDTIPDQVVLVTAGIDVQVDRLEMEVVGWGIGDESWSIEYLVFYGDPNSVTPWQQLEEALHKTYMREDGLELRIEASAVDTGGNATQAVIDFTRKSNRTVWAIKGIAGQGRPIFPASASRYKSFKGNRYYQVGVDTAKERIYAQLKLDKVGAGYCHFPVGYDDVYFDGLTSEEYEVKYKRGHPYKIWRVKRGRRNEQLDCRVYATAARFSIKTDMAKRYERMAEVAANQDKPEAAPEPTRVEQPLQHHSKRKPPVRARRTGGGYMSDVKKL